MASVGWYAVSCQLSKPVQAGVLISAWQADQCRAVQAGVSVSAS